MILHGAADELFDARDLCEGFADLNETRKGQAMLRQLSLRAGYEIQTWHTREHVLPFDDDAEYDDRPVEIAALTWRDASPQDCLAEAERIAGEIREG